MDETLRPTEGLPGPANTGILSELILRWSACVVLSGVKVKVNKIKFKKGNNLPTSVVVELTTDEAVFLTKLMGQHNEESAANIYSRGADLLDMYNDFAGYFFNRFWDSGVETFK